MGPLSGMSNTLLPAVASLSWRSANQRSYQQGRGRGLLVLPSGFVVMYVFSEGRGSRGLGATIRRRR